MVSIKILHHTNNWNEVIILTLVEQINIYKTWILRLPKSIWLLHFHCSYDAESWRSDSKASTEKVPGNTYKTGEIMWSRQQCNKASNTDQLYEIRFFAQENGVQFNCSNYFTFDYLAHGYWYIGMWLGSNPNWQELRSLRNSTSTICYGYDDNLIKFPVI